MLSTAARALDAHGKPHLQLLPVLWLIPSHDSTEI